MRTPKIYPERLKSSLSRSLGGLVASMNVLFHVKEKKKLRIYVGTWNMHGKSSPDELSPFVEMNNDDPYHIIAIGTQECERPIANSLFFAEKEGWERKLKETLKDYEMIGSENMAAIHLVVFVWKGCMNWYRGKQSGRIATGFGNIVANKGGVAIGILMGKTSLLFVNCHFAAHQDRVEERNASYHRLESELGLKGFILPEERNVSDRFDYTFWFGDLNYRVNGTRKIVDALLLDQRHEVLLANDQLILQIKAKAAFESFNEQEIAFAPTYKFDTRGIQAKRSFEDAKYSHSAPTSPNDINYPATILRRTSDGTLQVQTYDSGPKSRIPSWTDRILFKTKQECQIQVEKYTSLMEMNLSDHKPVVGIFALNFDWKELNDGVEDDTNHNPTISVSERIFSCVCCYAPNANKML